MDDVGAIILAGGRSSRFGSAKADAPFLGRPMLAWVVDAARGVASEVVVSASPGQRLPAVGSAVRVVEDARAFEGPLAGLIAPLWELDSEWVIALACDVPLLQPAVLEALLERRSPDVDAVVPIVGGFEQTLVAVYRREPALGACEATWRGGDRSIRAAVARLSVARVDEEDLRAVDPGLVSFRAANAPEELAGLERLAGSSPGPQDAPRLGGGRGNG